MVHNVEYVFDDSNSYCMFSLFGFSARRGAWRLLLAAMFRQQSKLVAKAEQDVQGLQEALESIMQKRGSRHLSAIFEDSMPMYFTRLASSFLLHIGM